MQAREKQGDGEEAKNVPAKKEEIPFHEWNKDRQWIYKLDEHRQSMFATHRFLLAAQLGCICFLAHEAFYTDDELLAKYGESANMPTIQTRFLCTVVLHIMLSAEFKQAFEMQKYALNHPWKFESWFQAFLIGFSQLFILFTFEILNTAILLTSANVMEVIMNFVALAVIIDFDDFLFNSESVRLSQLGELISAEETHGIDGIEVDLEDLVEVETTSGANLSDLSMKALFEDDSDGEENLVYSGRPKSARIEFSKNRTSGNKFCRIVYRVIKLFYQTTWFYWAPYMALFLAYWVPSKYGAFDYLDELDE